MDVSRGTKIGALVAACIVAGAGAAIAVAKLHPKSAAAAAKQSALRPGVIARPEDFGRGFGRRVDNLAAAAHYLGLSTADLFTRLRNGQTLAEIAESTSGRSVSGLVAALTAAEKARIEADVKSGRLTQTQAALLTANLSDRIAALVRRGLGFRHRGLQDGPPGTPL